MSSRKFAGSVNAPDFPPTLDWLNTDRPLQLADFNGKIPHPRLLDVLLN